MRSEIQLQFQKVDLTSVLLTSHYETKFLNRLILSSQSSVSTNIPHRLHITYTLHQNSPHHCIKRHSDCKCYQFLTYIYII